MDIFWRIAHKLELGGGVNFPTLLEDVLNA